MHTYPFVLHVLLLLRLSLPSTLVAKPEVLEVMPLERRSFASPRAQWTVLLLPFWCMLGLPGCDWLWWFTLRPSNV